MFSYLNEVGIHVTEKDLTSHIVDDCLTPYGENLWVIDFGTNTYNPAHYCSTEGEQGPRTPELPIANREWHSVKGDANETSKIIVYWEGSVSPRVVYGMELQPMVKIRACHNCTFDISGAVAGRAIFIDGSTNCHIKLSATEVGEGVYITNCENITTEGCDISQVGGIGINYFRSSGVTKNNSIRTGGLSTSSAAIYLARSNNVLACNNVISDYRWGNYWHVDGCGIYTEQETSNCTVTNNKIFGQFMAFQDNSGMPGNRFYGNEIYSCAYSLKSSDSESHGQADTEFENNILYQSGGRYRGDWVLPPNNMRIGMKYE